MATTHECLTIGRYIAVSALFMGLTACGAEAESESDWQRPNPPEVLQAALKSRELSPTLDGQELTALVTGNTEFALELFRGLRADNPDANLALGPYSVSQALAMLYAGARGDTATAMSEGMNFAAESPAFHNTFNGLDLELQSRNSDILLRNANQAWAARGVVPSEAYLDTLTRDYGAPLAVVDFAGDPEAARATINGWVADVTEKKIEQLFPPGTIDSSTVLALTNAMYMDAPWKYGFKPDQTRTQAFTLNDGSSVDVDMMHYDEYLPTGGADDWFAVELPYRGDEVSMYVVVPTNIRALEATLSAGWLGVMRTHIEDGGVHLSMPRFTFRSHASLEPAFRELGMGVLFDGPDLSGIGAGGVFVSAIEHEAFIEVDEVGTRAAAATGVSVALSHGPTVSVDRPFMFFIIDKPTGTLLFLGSVMDPRG